MKKRLYPENMETLFSAEEFTEDIVRESFDIKDGKWYVEDGCLVGFEAFCTRVKYKNLSIKRLVAEDDWKTYRVEF